MKDMKELRRFYDKILNNPRKYKLLWSLENKRSQWVKTTDDIIKAIQMNNTDLFFGVGMTDKAYGPKRRANLTQIAAMCCVYLDIDIASDNKNVHSKNNLPETVEEALEIAYKFIEPTFVIFSGHGIHAYYCFSDQVDLKKNEKFFASLLRQFQMVHRKAFPQYQIDYTHDFTRVMRCPGTVNAKDPDNPVECVVMEFNDVDYWLSEIEDAIEFNPDLTFETSLPLGQKSNVIKNPEKALTMSTTQEFIEWFDEQGLEMDPNASLDAETWVELEQMTNGKLGKIYHHRNMTNVDISSVDMSLANLGAKNCLNDQQIVDLMVMHRRKYNVKPHKLLRKDYYARTLINAISDRLLQNVRNKKIVSRQEAVGHETDNPENDTVIATTKRTIFNQHTPTEKQTIRKHLADIIGIEIKKITCYPKDPEPVFELELADMPGRTVPLGTYQKGIMSQANFRSRIASVGFPVPNKVPRNVWDPQVLKDLRILTEEGVIPETSTYEGQIKIFLREYFDAKDTDVVSTTDPKPQHPFISVGGKYVYFKMDRFRHWLQTTKGFAMSFDLENNMLQSGFRQNGTVYITPPNFYVPEKETTGEKDD